MRSKLRKRYLPRPAQSRLFSREVSHGPTWLQSNTGRRSPHLYNWNWKCSWTCKCTWTSSENQVRAKQKFRSLGRRGIEFKTSLVHVDFYYQRFNVNADHIFIWCYLWKIPAYLLSASTKRNMPIPSIISIHHFWSLRGPQMWNKKPVAHI